MCDCVCYKAWENLSEIVVILNAHLAQLRNVQINSALLLPKTHRLDAV